MALPDFSMRQLLEAGVHFGHQTHRWNPKMDKFIFGARNNVHILDLAQTVPMLYQALQAVSDTVAKGGRVLIVGTKRQATDHVADASRRSAQYYVNARWLGGMLTNWQTMSNSIKRLRTVEETLSEGAQGLTKKERLSLTRERDKLERALGGIKDMGGIPNLLFVIDTNKEAIALQEARRLNIPIAAIIDSNSNPDGIDFPVPGNDDAGRAISLYCDLIARAAIDGLSRGQTDMGIDLGASEEVPVELALSEPAEAPAPAEAVAKAPVEVSTEAPAEPTADAAADQAPATKAATPAKEAATPAKEAAAPAKEAATPAKEAAAPAEEADTNAEPVALFEAPEGEPDDLKQISGVGPVLETKLHELGIRKFSQIANFSPDDIIKVDDALAFKGRIDRDNWVEQATTLSSQ
uniref:30S ribosomal protein S2 n=1 Tax=Pararhizobium sp. IMCC3301 TaxID=3067904 RepID=UPI00274281A4|nr:30S ribosomal protein S2 [Pararhizobium sp. IMCC3301]